LVNISTERPFWATFMQYEQAVTARFNGRSIVALCSYAQAQCNDQQNERAYGQVVAVPQFFGSFESKS
jgi:hypothetical protein